MAQPGEPITSERRLEAADRQRQALELRRAGKPYRDIAEELGYSGPSGAYKAVVTALDVTLQEPAEAVRQMELERLDALQAGLWDTASKGDGPAVDRVLKVMERRARLLGLDAASKVELGGVLQIVEEIVDAIPGTDADRPAASGAGDVSPE